MVAEQYPLALPCMDPATAPGTSLLVSENLVRPVPAGLAGFAAVQPF